MFECFIWKIIEFLHQCYRFNAYDIKLNLYMEMKGMELLFFLFKGPIKNSYQFSMAWLESFEPHWRKNNNLTNYYWQPKTFKTPFQKMPCFFSKPGKNRTELPIVTWLSHIKLHCIHQITSACWFQLAEIGYIPEIKEKEKLEIKIQRIKGIVVRLLL